MSSSPWTLLHARLHQTIRQRKLFVKGQAILVAVSGGQDSLCLASLLRDLQPKWDWQLAIAHCNHRWAVDSPHLPAHVETIAAELNLPFYLLTAPDEVAQDSREATARSWRYDALSELAQSQHFSHVTTGHTASDRAETLLYNLIRGSGLDGLSALGWQRSLTSDITLVRPMLNITRAETGQFCTQAQLRVWDDPANDDLHYARNRIRQEVLPHLREHFNPNLEETLASTAEVIQADVEYLEQQAQQLYQDAVESFTLQDSDSEWDGISEPLSEGEQNLNAAIADKVIDSRTIDPKSSSKAAQSAVENPKFNAFRINRRLLQSQPLSLQRRVMRLCLLQILPKAPSFEHIEKLSALISAPNRSQTDPFPGGAIATVHQGWIEIKHPH